MRKPLYLFASVLVLLSASARAGPETARSAAPASEPGPAEAMATASAAPPGAEAVPHAAPDLAPAAPAASLPVRAPGVLPVLHAELRTHWWKPALVSLGATALFDSAGVALARTASFNSLQDTLGTTSLLAASVATSVGWAGLFDAATPGLVIGSVALSMTARGSVQTFGVLAVAFEPFSQLFACFDEPQCTPAEAREKAAAQARATQTFWNTTDLAIALSGLDILAQLLYGFLTRDGMAPPAGTLAPTAMQTRSGVTPGLAWSGSF